MGWRLPHAGFTQENIHDFLTRQGVGFVTLAVHLSLFWDTLNPFLLGFAAVHVLFYPIFMAYWQGGRQSKRLSLSLDTALYGIYQGLWGYHPTPLMIYAACGIVINLATGGPNFLIKASLFFVVGAITGGIATGFYFRPEFPLLATLALGIGLMLFLGAFGYRVFRINSRLRSTRNSLREQTEDLTSLNHLAVAVNSHLDINVLLEKIMHTIERVYPFEALYIVTFDEDEHSVEVAGIYGSTISLGEYSSFQKLQFDSERDKHSLFVRSLVNRKVAYVPEVTPELMASAAYIDRQLYAVKPSKSLAYFPVYIKNRVVAGACFINYAERFYLQQRDIEKVQDFLVQVGTAIRNATLFKDLVTAKEEADEARSKAEASEEAKSRFLANMSHEIRTPLTAVMGYADALQEDDITEEERSRFIGYILRSGRHLLSMISDILDISKIEASKIEVERISFNYINILYDVDSYLKIKCKEKNLDYSLDVHLPIPNAIIIDPTRLKQILLNLSNNAIKFTNSGSISISVNTLKNKYIEFRVSDTGIGISKEEQNKIFSAFDQADSSTTRLFGGTGLGLYISKNLAELLGGHLLVDSMKGVGSTFTLRLPFTYDESTSITSMTDFDRVMEQIKDSKDTDGIPQLEGRILLAEDNEDNQKLIARLVELAGLQIDVVENGKLAVEAVKNTPYDLILMDMQMPVMGGEEASILIRETSNPPPIVAITANVMKHQIDEYEALDFSEILEKPIIRQVFFSTLEKVLKAEASNRDYNVLIVEDNEVNQMILSRYVEKSSPNAEITIRPNGQEALDIAQNIMFDLVLMDMEMPIMGGLEATQKLRATGADMPIYIVTGNVDSESLDRCLSAGATGRINKPIDKQIIAKVISSALSQRQLMKRVP